MGEQKKKPRCAHDTSQPHYTMEERERACTPAALTMIPLPRSLTPSPSSGSHQDSDDLMMRERERDHFDYSYAADESAGRAIVSHRHTHTGIPTYRRTTDAREKDKHRDTGLDNSYSMQVETH